MLSAWRDTGLAITAILAATLAVWKFPVTQRVFTWLNRHWIEDRDRRLGVIIVAAVEPLLEIQNAKIEAKFAPRLAVLDLRTEQLVANGGESIFDRVKAMASEHAVMVTQVESLDDRMVGVESDTKTILATVRKNP